MIGYRRSVIDNNFKLSFPEATEQMLLDYRNHFYLHLSDIMVETIRLKRMSRENLAKHVQFSNPDLLSRYENGNRSVIIMMGHSGNWEWAGAATASKFNFKTIPIYRRVKEKGMNAFFYEIRSRHGSFPMRDKDASQLLAKEVAPCAVAMLADQTPGSKKGWWTTFLSQPTPFFRGSEILARRLTNFDVLFAHVHRLERGKYEIVLQEVESDWRKNKFQLTKSFSRFLEAEIRKDPVNWLWSHKRWKHKPSERSIFMN